jgi:two-component system, NarL family, response regulator NreC
VADDHTILRQGLCALLCREADMQVVGQAADGREALDLCSREKADVVLMDIAMAGMNGIEATRRITVDHPETRVAILSMHSDESYVRRALKAGASAYLLKESAQDDVVTAIRAVSTGKSFFSPRVLTVIQDDHRRDTDGVEDSYDLLTARERELLQLITEGCSNKEMAARLELSVYTIETHRRHILEKLKLHSGADLILYAVRKGLVH